MTKRELTWATLTAAILRLIQLGSADYWYDEGFTAVISRLPFARMLAATAGDVHPPLYYLITWVTQRVAYNEWVMRLPSVALSLLALYLAWLIIDQLSITRSAQIAVMVWLVISPLQLHYAQEARMYALLQVEVLAAIYFIYSCRRWLVAWVLVLMFYTHNYAVFYAPALAVLAMVSELDWILAKDRKVYLKTQSLYWFPVFLIPVLAWLPWAMVLFGQMSTVGAGYWIQPVTGGAVIKIIYQVLFAYSMPGVFQGLAVVLTAGVLAYTIWRVWRDRPAYWYELAIMAFLPLILAVFASVVWKPLLLFRGLVGSSVPLTILIVQAIDRIKTPYRKIYAYAMIGVVVVAGLTGHYLYNVGNKGDTSDWVGVITERWTHGDVILALNDNGVIASMTYAPDYPLYKLPPCECEALGSLSPATRSALGVVERDLNGLAAGRVWYISTVSPVSSVCEVEMTNVLIDQAGAELIRTLADTEYHQAGVYLITR